MFNAPFVPIAVSEEVSSKQALRLAKCMLASATVTPQ
jgi:hypothetical protein